MVRITVTEEQKKQFVAADGVIELRDESGELVMQVTVAHKPIPPDWVPVTPEPSEEELDRLSKEEGPTITSEELLARLRSKL